ncbi:phasin family protein [Pseudoponticoccus marisrubri]|uniref:Phasin domain-containing protein n=1 Tax=Pseudoponticoccus marisrubri TaxID=1685382 RepID=A0A0W7WJY2_9RHOB|nr:phasin family protein [Pseudoponticoccus marisrubri]KUF10925.1 hypothetical protein AVJ23_10865 [Pseudoponticoccus marisrubri]
MSDPKDTNPFDPGRFMETYWSMFDPKKQSELFDPQRMMETMKSMAPENVDFQEVFQRNQRNLEAVMQANEAAAQTYRGMLENQMEIFNRVSQEAKELATPPGSTDPAEAGAQYSQAYSRALELGLSLMTEMAEEVQKANQEVYGKYQERLGAAVSELKSK